MICQDKFYIEHRINNLTHELMSATDDLMPIVMVEDNTMDVKFRQCAHNSIINYEGFMIDVSLTGNYR